MIWQNDLKRLEKEKRRGEELADGGGGERTGHSGGEYGHAQTVVAGCGAPYSVPWYHGHFCTSLYYLELKYTTSILQAHDSVISIDVLCLLFT